MSFLGLKKITDSSAKLMLVELIRDPQQLSDKLSDGLHLAIFFRSGQYSEQFKEILGILSPYLNNLESISDDNKKLIFFINNIVDEKLLVSLYPLVADEMLMGILELLQEHHITSDNFKGGLGDTIRKLSEHYGKDNEYEFISALNSCIQSRERFDINLLSEEFKSIKNKFQSDIIYNDFIKRVYVLLNQKGYFPKDLSALVKAIMNKLVDTIKTANKPTIKNLSILGKHFFTNCIPSGDFLCLPPVAVSRMTLKEDDILLRRFASLARLLAPMSRINPAIAVMYLNSTLYISGNALTKEEDTILQCNLLQERFKLISETIKQADDCYLQHFIQCIKANTLPITYVVFLKKYAYELVKKLESTEYGGLLTVDSASIPKFISDEAMARYTQHLDSDSPQNPVQLRLVNDFLKILSTPEIHNIFDKTPKVLIPTSENGVIIHAEQTLANKVKSAREMLELQNTIDKNLDSIRIGISKLCCLTCFNDLTHLRIKVMGTSGRVFPFTASIEPELFRYTQSIQEAAMNPACSASAPSTSQTYSRTSPKTSIIHKLQTNAFDSISVFDLTEMISGNVIPFDYLYALSQNNEIVWTNMINHLRLNDESNLSFLVQHYASTAPNILILEKLFKSIPNLSNLVLELGFFSIDSVLPDNIRIFLLQKFKTVSEPINPDKMSFSSFLKLYNAGLPCFQSRENSVYLQLMQKKTSDNILNFLINNPGKIDYVILFLLFYEVGLLPEMENNVLDLFQKYNIEHWQHIVQNLAAGLQLNKKTLDALLSTLKTCSDTSCYYPGDFSRIIFGLNYPQLNISGSNEYFAIEVIFAFYMREENNLWAKIIRNDNSKFPEFIDNLPQLSCSIEIVNQLITLRPSLLRILVSQLGKIPKPDYYLTFFKQGGNANSTTIQNTGYTEAVIAKWKESTTFFFPDGALFHVFIAHYNPELACFKPIKMEDKKSVYIQVMQLNLPENIKHALTEKSKSTPHKNFITLLQNIITTCRKNPDAINELNLNALFQGRDSQSIGFSSLFDSERYLTLTTTPWELNKLNTPP